MAIKALLVCGSVNFALAQNVSLHDGRWNPTDIHAYRARITDKSKLTELMNLNETNETEMLLVTPYSDAPTTAQPTSPTPSPTPLTVIATKKYDEVAVTGNAADYVDNVTVTKDQTKTTTFKVKYALSVDPAPTEAQALTMSANVMSLPESAITVTINTSRRLDGRRLAAATVNAEGKTEDPSKADAAKAAASNKDNFVSALQTAGVQASVTIDQAPSLAAETVVTQAVDSLDDCLTGFTCAYPPTPTPTTSQPTSMPTRGPTSAPTNLPQGATHVPTVAPTAPTATPTVTPTTPQPTLMPTREPTSTPTNLPQGATFSPTVVPTAPTGQPTAPTPPPPTDVTPAPPATSAPSPATYAPSPATGAPSAPTETPTSAPTDPEEEESAANVKTAGLFWLLSVVFVAFKTI